MAEYIERELLLNDLNRIRNVYKSAKNFDAVSAIDNAIGEVKDTIAAVRPERHGAWITKYEGLPFCSECNYNGLGYIAVDLDFCPNCGAKMDGKDNDI